MNREQLIQHVQQQKGNYWSAKDQGRLARLDGQPISANPFHAVAPHAAAFDWADGWREVSA